MSATSPQLKLESRVRRIVRRPPIERRNRVERQRRNGRVADGSFTSTAMTHCNFSSSSRTAHLSWRIGIASIRVWASFSHDEPRRRWRDGTSGQNIWRRIFFFSSQFHGNCCSKEEHNGKSRSFVADGGLIYLEKDKLVYILGRRI